MEPKGPTVAGFSLNRQADDLVFLHMFGPNNACSAFGSLSDHTARDLARTIIKMTDGQPEAIAAESEEEITRLRRKVSRQAANITEMQQALERKNRELDALHMVWCDGGCPSGVHRWRTDLLVTDELIKIAERNTRRLRGWYRAVQFRLALQNPSKWMREYTRKAAAKTDLS